MSDPIRPSPKSLPHTHKHACILTHPHGQMGTNACPLCIKDGGAKHQHRAFMIMGSHKPCSVVVTLRQRSTIKSHRFVGTIERCVRTPKGRKDFLNFSGISLAFGSGNTGQRTCSSRMGDTTEKLGLPSIHENRSTTPLDGRGTRTSYGVVQSR